MLLFLFILILLYREYSICILAPFCCGFISIDALCWDIDFRRRVNPSKSISVSSRRSNSMNGNIGFQIIITECVITNISYTIRYIYTGKFIASKGAISDNCYTIWNGYAGEFIIRECSFTNFSYTI